MNEQQLKILRNTVAEGTGAVIEIATDSTGLQTSVLLWFDELRRNNGPYVQLKPSGLKRHQVRLQFGNFSGPVLNQIMRADDEAVGLARALLNSIEKNASVHFSDGDNLATWKVKNSTFQVVIERRDVIDYLSDNALIQTCKDIVIPLMAAMAELIGYDEILPELKDDEPAWEGAERPSVVMRRERNPRNRLLCLRIHGYSCQICGLDPLGKYGVAGTILEVHHLEPLAVIQAPRPYDPATDLIPLCPNCHKAVHTRRPVPWSPEDIRSWITSD
ncbi:MAG: HNH endonuclease [Alphaproteobacteria bacterium]|nr:HNH endonuclease [Alphaproteobacteria bacterium]NCT40036.1 HNH endonuclease [Alphaproteobacteria bacterium]